MQYFIFLLISSLFIFTSCSSKKNSSLSTYEDSKKAPASVVEEYVASPSAVMAEPMVVEPAPLPVPPPSIKKAPTLASDTTSPKVVSLSSSSSSVKRDVQSGILTAGEIDDNLNLPSFKKYIDNVLQSTGENAFPFMNTENRVKITIVDKNNKGINRVKVKIGKFIGYTNSAGILYIFPSVDKIPLQTTIEINGKSQPIDLSSKKEFIINSTKSKVPPKTLDLMFVIDSTGSMGDEMRYLTKEFDAIVSNVEEKYPNVDIRFGLTLYKDKGDSYLVKNFKFTSNKNKMKNQLNKQSATGGGDYPEAMEEGINKALEASWKAEDGTRVMFLIADAPPHDDKMKKIVPIINKARKMGIHIYPIGASGVAKKAEYIMRHLALFTTGRYLWLTDDSGVGNSHAEPKVKCYQVTRLDQLISRVIESELSGKRVEAEKDSIIRTVGEYNNGVCQ